VEYADLPGYCKYVSNAPAVLEGLFVHHKIRFTQPVALNDPIDCHPLLNVPCGLGQHTRYVVDGVHMPSANEWYHIQLIEARVNEFGILSLTKNPFSFDMWSKYANGHKGFLIELRADFNAHRSMCSDGGEPYPVVPVRYCDTFEVDLGECRGPGGGLLLEEFEKRFFYTKVNRWAAEEEFRMVRPLTDLGKPLGGLHVGTYRDPATIYLGDLPLELINTITFGANMPRDTKRWIIERSEGTNIQFLQCMLFPKEKDKNGLAPAVRLLVLDDLALRNRVLEMQPQLLLMGNADLLAKQTVQLQSTRELPYYSFHTELVDDLFRRLKNRRRSRR
jgi:hypothetical protein